MVMLQQRQYELKEAALKAKNDGDLDLARDYLRQAKGIQPLIQASIAGLPVDMNSIPLSPVAKMELSAHGLTGQTDENFQLIHSEDCLEESGGSDEQIYDNLENQLIKQIKVRRYKFPFQSTFEIRSKSKPIYIYLSISVVSFYERSFETIGRRSRI